MTREELARELRGKYVRIARWQNDAAGRPVVLWLGFVPHKMSPGRQVKLVKLEVGPGMVILGDEMF